MTSKKRGKKPTSKTVPKADVRAQAEQAETTPSQATQGEGEAVECIHAGERPRGLNLDFPSLDDALIDSHKNTEPHRGEYGLIRWEEAIMMADVYTLAARGEAEIRGTFLTARGDGLTAHALAYCLTSSQAFTHKALVALSMAKTHKERMKIYNDANFSLESLHVVHAMLVTMRLDQKMHDVEKELASKDERMSMLRGEHKNLFFIINKRDPAAQSGRADVTQEQAAKLCGVSKSTIRAWDRGEHTPEGYPGRADAVLLKAFSGRRKQGKLLKEAVVGATRYGDIDRASHRVERGGRR